MWQPWQWIMPWVTSTNERDDVPVTKKLETEKMSNEVILRVEYGIDPAYGDRYLMQVEVVGASIEDVQRIFQMVMTADNPPEDEDMIPEGEAEYYEKPDNPPWDELTELPDPYEPERDPYEGGDPYEVPSSDYSKVPDVETEAERDATRDADSQAAASPVAGGKANRKSGE